jgi:hypothetical protein
MIFHFIVHIATGLKSREYGLGDPLRWPLDALYPQKLAQTSPTSGGLSVGIVRSRTQAAEFFFFRYCDVKRQVKLAGITTDYGIYGREHEFNSWQDQEIFIFFTAFGADVGPTELPTQRM